MRPTRFEVTEKVHPFCGNERTSVQYLAVQTSRSASGTYGRRLFQQHPFAVLIFLLLALSVMTAVAEQPREFLSKYCFDCHNADQNEGGLDLASLKVELSNTENFAKWVKIHDRIDSGEMPPQKQERPPIADKAEVTKLLKLSLIKAEQDLIEAEPRTGMRRMTRSEYENTIRDLFDMPGIVLQNELPSDVAMVAARLKSGDCFETAMRQAYRTALCSPDFLYHLEDDDSSRLVNEPSLTPRSALDDFSLASRLSYLFWNSMPDLQLMELAAANTLHQPDTLKAQVERLLAAVEPDVRGATTIREQLAKHRDHAVCASCHARIDPPGFALESFDVIGGQRERYRTITDVKPVVDPSGILPDGRPFKDITDFHDTIAY